MEDRLGLTTVTGLLSVVTALTLGEEGSLLIVMLVCGSSDVEFRGVAHLASLVLGDLVLGVLLAVLALAVGPARLRDVDLWAQIYQSECSCCKQQSDLCVRG